MEREGPAASKETPYFPDNERRATDLNGHIRLAPGTIPGTDHLLCRHLARAYQRTAEDDDNGKFDFGRFAMVGEPHYDNFVDRAWRDNYLPPFEENLGLAPAMQRTVIDGDRFGVFLGEAFKELASIGKNHATAILSTANFGETPAAAATYTGHALSVSMRIKQDGEGRDVYVARVYDPNRTLTHKRVRVTDLQSLERLTFHDFLDTGVDYGRPSVLGVISPSLSLEHDPALTWTGDATLKGRLHLAMQANMPWEVRAIARQLRKPATRANLSDEELTVLLAAKDASGGSALAAAMAWSYANVMAIYGELVSESGLEPEAQAELLAARRNAGGVPELQLDVLSGQNDTLLAYDALMRRSGLAPEMQAELLAARRPADGQPAMALALLPSLRTHDIPYLGGIPLQIYGAMVLRSGLPIDTQAELLAGKNQYGVPALQLAVLLGYQAEVVAYGELLRGSRLPPATQAELLAARRADGVSAMELALLPPREADDAPYLPDALATYGTMILQSGLPVETQIDLLTSRNRPAFQGGAIFHMAMTGETDGNLIAGFIRMVLRSELPEHAKVTLLAARAPRNGPPALGQAVTLGNGTAACLFASEVLQSELAASAKVELIASEDATGTPALAVAMAKGARGTASFLVRQILVSDLPDAMKAELLAGKNAKGVTALEGAVKAGRLGVVESCRDLIGRSELPPAMQAKLLAGT
ncbi:type III effector, ospd family protein [Ralstonia solanacearum]|uniref:ShET2/EspL2 family type III secretion system effector toxin n=2 Tax=Ralstonia solanacearum TaxID=305 RepID=UPI0002F79A99|nr:ShET2/EspL2 family type III secretion system effector toxin [Ralstonia solanacearum]MDC6176483.1 ShET2/EspL2 family type III secretion system effector toxin [Ralstonia solanacearum]MDC6209647.1 ShET2/EspL2 family type III secretion system effector toxin [Ralstonia solanacearum]MDC6237917.1 ShET2/EspL2 family type III secretion system effector toxin [Ralstonia solanacearum]MDD7799421.1 ShET2/EspL2 family type III secretion system effector toxin [Ralstonia solanacearum]TYZ54161.1 type III eff